MCVKGGGISVSCVGEVLKNGNVGGEYDKG